MKAKNMMMQGENSTNCLVRIDVTLELDVLLKDRCRLDVNGCCCKYDTFLDAV
jgi:hypothetical protein